MIKIDLVTFQFFKKVYNHIMTRLDELYLIIEFEQAQLDSLHKELDTNISEIERIQLIDKIESVYDSILDKKAKLNRMCKANGKKRHLVDCGDTAQSTRSGRSSFDITSQIT